MLFTQFKQDIISEASSFVNGVFVSCLPIVVSARFKFDCQGSLMYFLLFLAGRAVQEQAWYFVLQACKTLQVLYQLYQVLVTATSYNVYIK